MCTAVVAPTREMVVISVNGYIYTYVFLVLVTMLVLVTVPLKGAIDSVRLHANLAGATAEGDTGVGGTLLRNIVSLCCLFFSCCRTCQIKPDVGVRCRCRSIYAVGPPAAQKPSPVERHASQVDKLMPDCCLVYQPPNPCRRKPEAASLPILPQGSGNAEIVFFYRSVSSSVR